MSGRKHFEQEVGSSLKICSYYYKPLDTMSNYNKVDYFCVWRGFFIAIEAKEAENPDLFKPFSDRAPLTPGQQMTLRDVTRGEGFGLLAVNYGRKPLSHSRGTCGIFLIRDGIDIPVELYRKEAEWQLDPVAGGTWNLMPVFNDLASRGLSRMRAGNSKPLRLPSST